MSNAFDDLGYDLTPEDDQPQTTLGQQNPAPSGPDPVQASTQEPAQPAPEKAPTQAGTSQNAFSDLGYAHAAPEVLAPPTQVEKVEDPGFLTNIKNDIAGGLLDYTETMARAGRALPGGPETYKKDDTSLFGKTIAWANEVKKAHPEYDHVDRDGLPRWFHEGLRSVVTSAAAGVPTAVAGAAIGSIGSPIGTALGAITGWALGAGSTFGLAEYDSFMQEARQSGVSEEDANLSGILSGLAEGGIEFASDMLQGVTMGASSVLTQPGKAALKQGVKSLFKSKVLSILKRQLITGAIEGTSEAVTGAAQTKLRQRLGMTDVSAMDAAGQAFGPAFVAGIMFGGVVEAGNMANRRSVSKALTNPKADPQKRLNAAKMVTAHMQKIDSNMAKVWHDSAVAAINNGDAIDLGLSKDEMQAKMETLRNNAKVSPKAKETLELMQGVYDSQFGDVIPGTPTDLPNARAQVGLDEGQLGDVIPTGPDLGPVAEGETLETKPGSLKPTDGEQMDLGLETSPKREAKPGEQMELGQKYQGIPEAERQQPASTDGEQMDLGLETPKVPAKGEQMELGKPYAKPESDAKNSPRFSKAQQLASGAQPTGVTQSEVASDVSSFIGKGATKRMTKSGKLEIVQSVADLQNPDDGENIFNKNGDIAGVYHKGKITLIADNIYPGDGDFIMRHEGMHRLMKEDKQFRGKKDQILRQFKAMRETNPAVSAAYKAATASITTDQEGGAVHDEEAFGYFLQNQENHQSGLVKRMVSNVRAWMSRNGFNIKQFSDQDMISLVEQSVKSQSGKKLPGGVKISQAGDRPEDPRYSKQDELSNAAGKTLPNELPGGRRGPVSGRAISPREAQALRNGGAGALIRRIAGYDAPGEKGYYLVKPEDATRQVKDYGTGQKRDVYSKETQALINKIAARESQSLETVTINGRPELVNPKHYNPKEPSTRYSKRQADSRVSDSGRKQDSLGFYSALSEAAANTKQPAMKAEGWVNTLKKQPNVKQEEIEWTGLSNWLDTKKGQKVSREEVQQFLDQGGVKIEEVTKGAPGFNEDAPALPQDSDLEVSRAPEDSGSEFEFGVIDPVEEKTLGVGNTEEDAILDAYSGHPEYWEANGDETKYQPYTLPGGENYREVLMTLPRSGNPDFTSPHWDEPNVLAHIRLDDRTVNGEKVLFVEEIQSDWNLAGRKNGFKGDLENLDGTPTAPFVQDSSWQNLTLKRIMRMAAEGGYDRVAWVNGEQTADRYSLDKQLDRIIWTKNGENDYSIVPVEKGAGATTESRLTKENISADEISEFVGKDIAEKIVNDGGVNGVLQGDDLKIEATWARELYDKAVPSWMKKFGKKYGAQVEDVALQSKLTNGATGKKEDTTLPWKQQSLSVTDAMREAVDAGQPLFSKREPIPGVTQKSEALAPSFSVRTYKGSITKLKDLNKGGVYVPKDVMDKYVKDISSIASIILGKPALDYASSGQYTSLKKNSDPHYKRSLDFSTICRKRRAMAATLEAVQKRLGRGLAPSEIERVIKELADREIVVGCGPCYVDASRMQLGMAVNRFLNYNKQYEPYRDLFLNQEGFDALAENSPKIYKEFKGYIAAQNIKISESRTEYRDEILDKSAETGIPDAMVQQFNARGGMRWQSWSDFELVHLIDAMQAIGHMAARGLMGHVYTKVPELVKALGRTGMMINLSLIPEGNGVKNGKLAFSSVEGLDYKTAMDLRKEFSDTAGTIAIGVSDENIRLMMADPTIDFIIPYHVSGMPLSTRTQRGMGEWTNYADYERELIGDSKKATKKDLADFEEWAGSLDWWDTNLSGDENAQFYLDQAFEKGITPKFPQFLKHNEDGSYTTEPGYWKMIIDHKMYNNDGLAIEQQVVQPVFDSEVIQKLLNDYKADPVEASTEVVDALSKEFPEKLTDEQMMTGTQIDFVKKNAIFAKGSGDRTKVEQNSYKSLMKKIEDGVSGRQKVDAGTPKTKLSAAEKNGVAFLFELDKADGAFPGRYEHLVQAVAEEQKARGLKINHLRNPQNTGKLGVPQEIWDKVSAANQLPETYHDTSPEREAIRDKARKEYRKKFKATRQERKAHLILGLAASGKSAIAEPLAKSEGAILLDSDEYKKLLPEYANGFGANSVHEESSSLVKESLAEAIVNGDNLVYPTVGGNHKSLKKIISKLEDNGYEVNLEYMYLPEQEAINRVVNRYDEERRLVNPDLIGGHGSKPIDNYLTLVKEGYNGQAYDNQVPRGEKPISIEAEELRQRRMASERRGPDVGQPGLGTRESQEEEEARLSRRSAREYTPEQRAALKTGGFGVKKKPAIRERWTGITDNIMAKMRQGMIDQFSSLKDVSPSAWMKARMSKSSSGALAAAYLHGKLRMDKDGAVTVDENGNGLVHVLSPLGDEVDDFFNWIAGNRAEKLAKEGKENLFSEDNIRALKSLATGKLPDGRDRALVYQKTFKQFNEFKKSILDIARDSGLLDAEATKQWDDDFYVPFYRVLEEQDQVRGPKMGGGLVRQQAFKKLKGGTDQLNDLLNNTLMNWEHLISASLKNNAARDAMDAGEKLGIVTKLRPFEAEKNKNAVFVMENGKQVHYQVDDPLVLEAISAINHVGANNPAMKVMRSMKRVFTTGVTASPAFRVANLLRDTIQSVAVTPVSKNFGKNVAQGFAATRKGSLTAAQMMAGGATMDFGYQLGGDTDAAKKLIRRLQKDGGILVDGKPTAKFKDALSKAWRIWEDTGNRAENVNRGAVYQQMRDQGKSHAEAAFAAADVMDFRQGGSWPAVRFMVQVVPFLNARLQGLDKLGRSAVDPKQRAQFSVAVAGYTMAASALYLMFKDDDDFKKREDWDKDTYLWFKLPGTKTAFRIPAPFEVGAVGSMSVRLLEQIVDDEATPKLFADRLYQTLTQTFSFSPVPQAFQPALNVYANKDPFTQRQIESMSMRNAPATTRKRPTTSSTASVLSQAMGAVAPEAGTLSPVQIQYLIEGYLGWTGSLALAASDILVRPAIGDPSLPAKRLDQYPVLKRFVRENPAMYTKYTGEFYDQLREINLVAGQVRSLKSVGEVEKAKEVYAQNKTLLNKRTYFSKKQRAMANLNKQMKILYASDLDADTKQREIERVQMAKNALAEQAVNWSANH